jgi:apolipoprotein N-acyltransferase
MDPAPPSEPRLPARLLRRLRLAAIAGALSGIALVAAAADRLAGRGALGRFAISAAAGALAALAMAPFHLVPLLFLAFTVLVWLIDGLGLARRLASAALIGWAFGLGFFAVGLYWIGNAFLVDAEMFGALMPAAMLGLTAGLALFPLIAIVLARLFWRTGSGRVLVLALSWTALEWLRGHILTGFPWHLAGYVWGDALVMLQPASLVGIYGLSLITVFAACSPAALASFAGGQASASNLRALLWPGAAALLLLALLAFGAWRLAAPPSPSVAGVRLRIVQASIPQADKINSNNAAAIFRAHLDLTLRPGIEKITHVIWTEAAVPVLLPDQPDALAAIGSALGPGRWLIAGSARREPPGAGTRERFFNSLLVVSSAGAVVAAYDKHHLVPFGEYLPLEGLLARLRLRQIVENGTGFSAGPGVRTLGIPGAPEAGALICYEAIFPGAVVERARRPSWLLNITDDTWFGHGVGPRQHFEIARVRAIEEGLPLVRAANNGISAVIDARGRVLASLGFDAVDVIDSPLPARGAPTIYARIGDFGFLGMWVFGALLIFGFRRGKGVVSEL